MILCSEITTLKDIRDDKTTHETIESLVYRTINNMLQLLLHLVCEENDRINSCGDYKKN